MNKKQQAFENLKNLILKKLKQNHGFDPSVKSSWFRYDPALKIQKYFVYEFPEAEYGVRAIVFDGPVLTLDITVFQEQPDGALHVPPPLLRLCGDLADNITEFKYTKEALRYFTDEI